MAKVALKITACNIQINACNNQAASEDIIDVFRPNAIDAMHYDTQTVPLESSEH